MKYQKPFWIGLVIAAVLVAAILSYLLFFKNLKPKEQLQDVRLKIEAPTETVLGSEISYRIKFQNLSNTPLTNLALEVFYPPGFEFIDSTPDPPSSETTAGMAPRKFLFADLNQNQEHELIIIGKLSGNIQEIKTFNAKLHYVPMNFRSTFVATAAASTILLPPHLTLALQAPAHLIAGQVINYEISIENVAEDVFRDIELTVSFPPRFETDAAAAWQFTRLEPGEKKTILLSGRLFEEPGKESLISAELFLKDEQGERILAGRSFAFTLIRPSPLRLTHRTDGLITSVKPGQKVNYIIEYENTSPTGLTDLVITASIDEPELSSFLKLESSQGRLQGQKILWFPGNNPELLVLNPGEKGQLSFSVQSQAALAGSLIKNPVLKTKVEFITREVPQPISSDRITLPFATELDLSGKATPVSREPPRAVYEIELEIRATVNDVSDALLVGVIPHGQAEVSSADATVQFNSLNGRLVWQVESIPAFSAKKLSFSLSFSTNEEGSSLLPLVRDIQVTGKDSFTSLEVSSPVLELVGLPTN